MAEACGKVPGGGEHHLKLPVSFSFLFISAVASEEQLCRYRDSHLSCKAKEGVKDERGPDRREARPANRNHSAAL